MNSIRTSTNLHKYKDYRQKHWRMVTWWSFESEEFNVWIRSYHPNVGRFGKEVKLSVSSHSGSRQAFKLQVVKAALGVAIRVKGMDEETAMEFEAATENESEAE